MVASAPLGFDYRWGNWCLERWPRSSATVPPSPPLMLKVHCQSSRHFFPDCFTLRTVSCGCGEVRGRWGAGGRVGPTRDPGHPKEASEA